MVNARSVQLRITQNLPFYWLLSFPAAISAFPHHTSPEPSHPQVRSKISALSSLHCTQWKHPDFPYSEQDKVFNTSHWLQSQMTTCTRHLEKNDYIGECYCFSILCLPSYYPGMSISVLAALNIGRSSPQPVIWPKRVVKIRFFSACLLY